MESRRKCKSVPIREDFFTDLTFSVRWHPKLSKWSAIRRFCRILPTSVNASRAKRSMALFLKTRNWDIYKYINTSQPTHHFAMHFSSEGTQSTRIFLISTMGSTRNHCSVEWLRKSESGLRFLKSFTMTIETYLTVATQLWLNWSSSPTDFCCIHTLTSIAFHSVQHFHHFSLNRAENFCSTCTP